MDRDVLMHQMEVRFREGFLEALQALENAPDGHWIDDCEMAFRDAALTVAREQLGLAVQAKVDADPTAQPAAPPPPPSEPSDQDLPPARDKGDRPLNVLTAKVRSTRKKKALRLLRNYLRECWGMADYRRALARGWDIGSEPTEAMCKNLTLRLKRTGMKWDPANAAAMMNLVALRESGQWDSWWTTSAA